MLCEQPEFMKRIQSEVKALGDGSWANAVQQMIHTDASKRYRHSGIRNLDFFLRLNLPSDSKEKTNCPRSDQDDAQALLPNFLANLSAEQFTALQKRLMPADVQ